IAGDRYRREWVLLGGYLAQALSMLATAVALLTEAPVPLVYGLAALAATSITITRPAQSALLPTLARTPAEATGANGGSSGTESPSVLAGPALAALLLGRSGPGAVFAVMAAVLACSGLLVTGIRTDPVPGLAPPGGGRGVGLLNSAGGAGAIAGSALTVLLVGRRLVAPIVIGFACWGLALGAVGLVP